ncbi:MAG: TIR domain-containing protein [Flavobacteriaceae bacterium]|nr:TIR domain-containing protein [Flavobacteriaceae bacterium]
MGKKIFVSYKYADRLVRQFQGSPTTVRDYVDILQNKIDKSDHINKGEDDGEDMSSLADSTIASKLGNKIFDSSVTIVFISKGMKENDTPEKDQWIHWEISYSLREQSRQYANSKTNAILAVVLPDESGSYEYFIKDNTCPHCNCKTLQTSVLFQILKYNMFNIKQPEFSDCQYHGQNRPYKGYSSYIYSVKWDDFIDNINKYVDIAVNIWKNRNDYNNRKTV